MRRFLEPLYAGSRFAIDKRWWPGAESNHRRARCKTAEAAQHRHATPSNSSTCARSVAPPGGTPRQQVCQECARPRSITATIRIESNHWKTMPSVGSGAYEIRIRDDAGAFRVVYVGRPLFAVFGTLSKTPETRLKPS